MLRLPPVPALTPLLLLLALNTSPASAQAYKWKDAHGIVQYTQSPPPEGVKYQQIKTASSDAPLVAPAPAARPVDNDTAEPTAAAKPMADTPENRSKMCAALRANLAALNGSTPVVMAQNGKTVALDADQRKQQTAATQAQLQQYCQ